MLERQPRAAAPRPAPAAPLRILHVAPAMNRGGIETSLMQVLRTIDRARYRMDFLTVSGGPGVHDDEIRALGSRVMECPGRTLPWRFVRRFNALLRQHGPYDVVHSHVHYHSGLVLRCAARCGVPGRIAHSRNDVRVFEVGRPWPRRLYVRLMKRWIRRYATFRVAISRAAADDLFDGAWHDDPAFRMVFSGRDFAPYGVRHDRAALRASLGLPEGALVIGHIGRFHLRKNHDFIVEVAAAALGREARARLLLVGDGPEQARIEARLRAAGLAARVVLTGARDDIPALLQAMDVFIFPSHHEGLGLVVVEAQAAGLCCVIADTLPEEIDVVPELIRRLPLGAPAGEWAARLLALAGRPPMPADRALAAVARSDFAIAGSLQRLVEVYDAVAAAGARSR
jgi:glycosyltransferase involved in cell wall biosynthesis